MSNFSHTFVYLTIITGILLGTFEYLGGLSLQNIFSHFSFSSIGAVLIVFWYEKVKLPYKRLGFLWIGTSIFLHSISNQYANLTSVNEKNSYFVVIAEFLKENTPLVSQWYYTQLLYYIALALISVYFIFYTIPLLRKRKDMMILKRYNNLLEIFPHKWFDKRANETHPLYILNKNKKYPVEYFENLNNNLLLLEKQGLTSKHLVTKLMNPSQFKDTLIEIKVAVYLLNNGIKVDLPPSFPDIEIPEEEAIIEVKNLHTSEKLSGSKGDYAVEFDDINRIWDIITERIIPKLDKNSINLILINVPSEVDFDEFEDLFIFCERSKSGVIYKFDKKTREVISEFAGEFSRKENKIISGVIMMKNNYFKGIINPLNEKDISEELISLFNLIKIKLK